MGSKLVYLVMAVAFGGAIFLVTAQGPTPVAAAPITVAATKLPAAAPAALHSDGPTGFVADFDGSLVSQSGGAFQDFPPAALKNVKYWAFYYSAAWCPPCRAFTPKLVDFYKKFKPTHPNFELIFVSHDTSEAEMLAYVRDESMAWPAVRFDAIDRVKADRFLGEAIPDLVLVDGAGKVLSDTFDGSTYLGPQKVLDDIQTKVPTP